MKTFKAVLKDGRIITTEGDRLWATRDHESSNDEKIIEVLINTPDGGNECAAVFLASQIIGISSGEIESPEEN